MYSIPLLVFRLEVRLEDGRHLTQAVVNRHVIDVEEFISRLDLKETWGQLGPDTNTPKHRQQQQRNAPPANKQIRQKEFLMCYMLTHSNTTVPFSARLRVDKQLPLCETHLNNFTHTVTSSAQHKSSLITISRCIFKLIVCDNKTSTGEPRHQHPRPSVEVTCKYAACDYCLVQTGNTRERKWSCGIAPCTIFSRQ